MAGDDASCLDGSVETPLPLSRWKIPNDESSFTSVMVNYFVWKRSYGTNHSYHREHEYHLLIIVAHAYTPVSLV